MAVGCRGGKPTLGNFSRQYIDCFTKATGTLYPCFFPINKYNNPSLRCSFRLNLHSQQSANALLFPERSIKYECGQLMLITLSSNIFLHIYLFAFISSLLITHLNCERAVCQQDFLVFSFDDQVALMPFSFILFFPTDRSCWSLAGTSAVGCLQSADQVADYSFKAKVPKFVVPVFAGGNCQLKLNCACRLHRCGCAY